MFRCVPHSLMDCVSRRARAARSKVCKVQIMFKQISEVTWVYAFNWHSINSSRWLWSSHPMHIVSKHSVLSRPVLPLFFVLKLSSSVFLSFYLDTIFRAQRGNFFNVYFLFLCIAYEEGRARSVENVSICNSLSYVLRKKKAARKCFQILHHFSQICVGIAPKVCGGKMQNPGHPKSLCT